MGRVIHPGPGAGPAEVGAKGFALVRAAAAGMRVPPWIAIAPGDEGELAAMRDALIDAALAIGEGHPLAVRSSASEEDGAGASFAGQLASFLRVPLAEVPARVADVRRSASRETTAAYRARHGIEDRGAAPAVLVQRMVEAEAAGIAFSADPVSGRRSVAVVAAGRGLGDAIAAGDRDADTWQVDRHGAIVRRNHGSGGSSLTDAQVAEVAALARRCQRCFGEPQDIEWAYEGGVLWLLQSRPITTLAGMCDPDGELALWDNSNIAESYGGVTTPLTFSYIRRNYEHVYRTLLRVAGVPREVIAAHEEPLRRLLGLFGGRVYYNLLSWYRLLALVPAFAHNQRFLDQMLGVREPAARLVLQQVAMDARATVAFPRLAACRLAFRLAMLLATVERENTRFLRRVDVALAAPPVPVEAMRADELVAYYRSLDRALLHRWDAPLVNDFFAMVFHGLLRRLLGKSGEALGNDLLCGQQDIVSLEPARRIREMASMAAADTEMGAALCEAPLGTALAALARRPRLEAAYREYLARFGERCFEELKLESLTLHEDPLPLLRAIGQLAARPRTEAGSAAHAARHAAEQRMEELLGGHRLRHLAARWLLGQVRARVRDRENMRFQRTRVYARVRTIVGELGLRLCAAGALDAPRDVYYLELDEVLRAIDGTATTRDLRALVAVRRREFAGHASSAPPPPRFETRGIATRTPLIIPAPVEAPAPSGAQLRQGTGCGPGKARGRVRVVSRPECTRLEPGEVLVAQRTDPGWVMLFATATALVVERGSLLSHAAIVARELGIPTVVGLGGACGWLADGDWVEVDGAAGTVRRLAGQGAP